MSSSFPLPRSLRCVLVALLLSASSRAQLNYATPYSFTTLTGTHAIGSTDGTGAAARFNYPQGVATDSSGNVYVADTRNYTIRKITPAGVVTTFAGSPGSYGTADGPAGDARFASVVGIAVDATGNLYVASNLAVRKITPAGVVTTLAGHAIQNGFVDGPGTVARFNALSDLAVDPSGNVYVADSFNHAVRKIAPDGTVSTVSEAGAFIRPQGIAADASGNVYVSDQDASVIRKITAAGMVTLAGAFGTTGSADGTGTAARFAGPSGLGLDGAGNVYVAEMSNHTIRKVTPDGVVTTVAGRAQIGGSADGTGSGATFYYPQDVTADALGNLYVTDTYSHTIRKITATGQVTTFAGANSESVAGNVDGPLNVARFRALDGIAIGPGKELYVGDWANHTVRKITPEGIVSTLAGTAGSSGSADGTGTNASFTTVEGVAVDGTGLIYVTDTVNHTIRKITPTGVVTTLAGQAGFQGAADGTGGSARFNRPWGIALDSAGNLIVADNGNGAIRKVTPAGVVTTVAGGLGQPGAANGPAASARFASPYAVTVDPTGNIFVSDFQCVRKITPAGDVTTFAGELLPPNTSSFAPVADGTGTAARFWGPIGGLAADRSGNIFVGGWYGGLVRKISPDGVVTTLAGTASAGFNRDGIGNAAAFVQAQGIAVDANGTLYVTSTNAVHKGRLAAAPVISTQPQSLTVTAGGNVQFSVTADAAPDPTYQWFVGGTAFSGATGSSLSFTNARSTDAGDYTVVVANSLGSVTSAKATLTVSAASTPSAPSGGSGGGSGGGGGGGAPSGWFALALLALVTARRSRPQRT